MSEDGNRPANGVVELTALVRLMIEGVQGNRSPDMNGTVAVGFKDFYLVWENDTRDANDTYIEYSGEIVRQCD